MTNFNVHINFLLYEGLTSIDSLKELFNILLLHWFTTNILALAFVQNEAQLLQMSYCVTLGCGLGNLCNLMLNLL